MATRRVRAPREALVTPLDVELLRSLEAAGSVVQACARIGITRDTGMYRLRRLARAMGSPVVRSRRGGSTRGGTRLTELGGRILEQGVGPLPAPSRGASGRPLALNLLRGRWWSAPEPHVTLEDDLSLFVTFRAREGGPVRVAIEPEAMVVATSRFPSSARNVIRGTVESVRRVDDLRAVLRVRVGEGATLNVAMTPRSLVRLRLRPGVRVYLYLKATAVVHLA